jgi:hypothetical protein
LITEAVVSIHSLKADPYPIPSQNLKAVNGSVLDLKDAFFTNPLHQYIFAFEWEDPFMRVRQQYTWIVLLQRF